MVDISLEAVNLAKWKQAGKEVGKALSGRELMVNTSRVLGKRFKLLSKKSFTTQGSSTGQNWKELSEPYRTIKARKFPGKTILRRKNDLFKSYTRKPVSLSFKSSGGFTYVYGSRDEKAPWHQKGTSEMPARKVLQYTPQQLLGITASIRRVMVDTIKKRKFFDKVPSARLAISNSGFDRVVLP